MSVENQWRLVANGNPLIVVAGASENDPRQGIVAAARVRDGKRVVVKKVLAPTKHGSVHIVGKNRSHLIFAARDGTTFTIDLQTVMS